MTYSSTFTSAAIRALAETQPGLDTAIRELRAKTETRAADMSRTELAEALEAAGIRAPSRQAKNVLAQMYVDHVVARSEPFGALTRLRGAVAVDRDMHRQLLRLVKAGDTARSAFADAAAAAATSYDYERLAEQATKVAIRLETARWAVHTLETIQSGREIREVLTEMAGRAINLCVAIRAAEVDGARGRTQETAGADAFVDAISRRL